MSVLASSWVWRDSRNPQTRMSSFSLSWRSLFLLLTTQPRLASRTQISSLPSIPLITATMNTNASSALQTFDRVSLAAAPRLCVSSSRQWWLRADERPQPSCHHLDLSTSSRRDENFLKGQGRLTYTTTVLTEGYIISS